MTLTATQAEVFRSNIGTVYSFNNDLFKLVHCKHPLRMPGWEEQNPSRNYTPKGEAGNDTKLCRNISRAKNTIFELAYCNQWDFFVTMTFDRAKVSDRYDLDAIMKGLTKWLSNYSARHADRAVVYLLIPEKHKDGAWHLHGFLRGIPAADLHEFTQEEHLPYGILERINSGKQVYTWTPYARKYGHCTLEPIQSREGVSKYVTKYITKDLRRSVEEVNAHLYYCTQGLNRKQLVYREEVTQDFTPDFENEHVRIKQSKDLAELIQVFCTD